MSHLFLTKNKEMTAAETNEVIIFDIANEVFYSPIIIVPQISCNSYSYCLALPDGTRAEVDLRLYKNAENETKLLTENKLVGTHV